MSAKEFLDGAFGQDNDQEKVEHFEQSTLKLLLRRAGWSNEQIGLAARELGPAFAFEWFNNESVLDFPVFADRCFDFNVKDLLIKPLKCKLLQQFHSRWLAEGEGDLAIIFKAYDIGRIVVSRGATCEQSALSRPSFPCVMTTMAPGLVVQVQPWNVFCNFHLSPEEDTDV